MEKGQTQETKRFQQVMGGVVVIEAGQVLVLKRAADEELFAGCWEFPAGKKELGETLEKAVIRECFEETGLTIEIVGLLDYFEFGVATHGAIRDVTQINFVGRITGKAKKVVLSDSHQEYRWIGPDEFSLVANDNHRRSLERALEKTKEQTV